MFDTAMVAAELDPLSAAVQTTVAVGLYQREDLDTAATTARRAAALGPDLPGPIRLLSQIEAARRRLPEAFELANLAVEKQATPPVRASLTRAYAGLGRIDRARAILSELEQEPDACVACIIDVRLALGDLDGALGRVEWGGWTPAGGAYFPNEDPAYDRFRRDKRFAELLKRLRLT